MTRPLFRHYAGSVIEAGGATRGTPVANGTLTDTDADNAANSFIAVSSPDARAIRATAASSSRRLACGLTRSTTATGLCRHSTLGDADRHLYGGHRGWHTQVVTITIIGTNDAAIISGATTGMVVEAGGTSPGTPTRRRAHSFRRRQCC
jgi:hypothetical protein